MFIVLVYFIFLFFSKHQPLAKVCGRWLRHIPTPRRDLAGNQLIGRVEVLGKLTELRALCVDAELSFLGRVVVNESDSVWCAD